VPEKSLSASALAHLRHHKRFYAAVVLGLLLFVATGGSPLPFRLIVATDTFFVAYLVLISFVLERAANDLRRRAAIEDEGIVLVILIVLMAVASSCGSVVIILHQNHGRISPPLVMALAGAPLGWFTLHIVAAFHYANLFYGPPGGRPDSSVAPLQFPGGELNPSAWDFLYYAFVVGMTAQVSDVQVVSPKLRRATLAHGVVSFFFNTVLIAMAVNAVVNIAS
jgi:uncharacterized membrane protein